jgi:DNA-binding CsgD family transcriptional regulator
MDDWNNLRAPEAVSALREAAPQPELWIDALQNLADAFHAEGWVIKYGPPSLRAPIWSSSLDKIFNYGLREGWCDKDARLQRCLTAFAEGKAVVTESMVFNSSELDSLPYNAEFINRFDLRWFAATVLAGEGPSSLVLELQRTTASRPFSTAEIDMLGLLSPQIREAGNLGLCVRELYHKTLLEAFGAFKCGVVLLDWKGCVLEIDPKTESMLSPGLRVRRGSLRANSSESDSSLQKLIHSAIVEEAIQASNGPRIVAIKRPGMSPLLVQVLKLAPPCAERFFARAVLTIMDRAAQDLPEVPDLRQIFRLTASEAQVAVALAEGHDIDEIAEMRGVSPGTLRAQLRSIFAKTDTRRQAELVGLLLRYSALIR